MGTKGTLHIRAYVSLHQAPDNKKANGNGPLSLRSTAFWRHFPNQRLGSCRQKTVVRRVLLLGAWCQEACAWMCNVPFVLIIIGKAFWPEILAEHGDGTKLLGWCMLLAAAACLMLATAGWWRHAAGCWRLLLTDGACCWLLAPADGCSWLLAAVAGCWLLAPVAGC